MIKKISNILSKDEFYKYKIYLFLNIINFTLEFVSLVSIPIFIASIISPERLLLKVGNFEKIIGFEISFISNENIVMIFAIITVLSFYLKNFFITFQILKEKKFYKELNLKYKKFFFKYYIDMPYLLHTKKNPSELVRGTLNDIKNVTVYLEHLCIFSRDTISLIVIFLISSFVSFTNTIIILIIFFILIFVYFKLVKPKIKKKASINQNLENKIIKTLNEIYAAIKDIKILSKQDLMKQNFEKKIGIYESNRFFFELTNKFPKIVMEITAITLIIAISVSYYLTTNDSQKLFNILAVNTVLILRFIPAFNSLTLSYGLLKMTNPSLNFLNDQIIEIKKIEKISKIDVNKKVNKSINKNFLSIENLSFGYRESKKPQIENLNLSINKGDIIGITGETGSGKTTLLHIFLGLIPPNKGNIYYNGKDIFSNLNSWRRNVGYISQDIFLLDSSIRENITFNNNVEKEKENFLHHCIEISKLKKKIDSLPNGIETNVGVNGLELSGGERQRIAIARTLYKNPKVVFLDEFTSALDEQTEKDIFKNLIKFKDDKTFIIVSHKLSTLKFCNKLLNIKNGKFSELNENF